MSSLLLTSEFLGLPGTITLLPQTSTFRYLGDTGRDERNNVRHRFRHQHMMGCSHLHRTTFLLAVLARRCVSKALRRESSVPASVESQKLDVPLNSK